MKTSEDIVKCLNIQLGSLRALYAYNSNLNHSNRLLNSNPLIFLHPIGQQLSKECSKLAENRMVSLFRQELQKAQDETEVTTLLDNYQNINANLVNRDSSSSSSSTPKESILEKINKLASGKIKELSTPPKPLFEIKPK